MLFNGFIATEYPIIPSVIIKPPIERISAITHYTARILLRVYDGASCEPLETATVLQF